MSMNTQIEAACDAPAKTACPSLILAMLEPPVESRGPGGEDAPELTESVPWRDALNVIREHATEKRGWDNARRSLGMEAPEQAELPGRWRGPGRGTPFERRPLEAVDRRTASLHAALAARALPHIVRLQPGDFPDELVGAGSIPPARRAAGLASECLAADTIWGRREDDPLVANDVAWGIVRQCVESFLGVPGYRVWRGRSSSTPWVAGLTLVSRHSPHNRVAGDDALGIQAARRERPGYFVDERYYGELSTDDWNEIRQSLAGLLHARILARYVERLQTGRADRSPSRGSEARADGSGDDARLNRGVMALCQRTIMSCLDAETSRALLSEEHGLAWIHDTVRDMRAGLAELGYTAESVGIHRYDWV